MMIASLEFSGLARTAGVYVCPKQKARFQKGFSDCMLGPSQARKARFGVNFSGFVRTNEIFKLRLLSD